MSTTIDVVIDFENFKIIFPSGDIHLDYYKKQKGGSIYFNYFPKSLMLSHQAEHFLEKKFSQLLEILISKIDEHQDFYRYFDVSRMSSSSGSISGTNDLGQEGVYQADCELKFRLKKEFQQ